MLILTYVLFVIISITMIFLGLSVGITRSVHARSVVRAYAWFLATIAWFLLSLGVTIFFGYQLF